MPWAFQLAEDKKADVFVYDADGMGAPSMKLYTKRAAVGKKISIVPYYGSGKKYNEDALYKDNKTNKDTFVNRRAQSWMNVRDRIEKTYLAVVKKEYQNPDELISISSGCKYVTELCAELSRPMRVYDGHGRIGVESKLQMKQRGVESPNLADQFIYSYDMESTPMISMVFTMPQPIKPMRVSR